MENYAANLSMMKRCRLYIDENLHDKKLLQGPALAQHFDCSYTNFRRIFHAIGGYTVHEYVQTRRVQKAAMCLRKGQSMEEAKASTGYSSDVGFRKAFISVYGMSPAVFAEDRGEGLMREPEIMTREGFYVVGYKLPAPDEIKLEECGAYWIAQDYPSVSAREYGRIGGGAEMIGVFVRDGERNLYLHGPGVPKVRYVPENMMAHNRPVFCAIQGAVIRDLGVEGILTSEAHSLGALAGKAIDSRVENCYAAVDVSYAEAAEYSTGPDTTPADIRNPYSVGNDVSNPYSTGGDVSDPYSVGQDVRNPYSIGGDTETPAGGSDPYHTGADTEPVSIGGIIGSAEGNTRLLSCFYYSVSSDVELIGSGGTFDHSYLLLKDDAPQEAVGERKTADAFRSGEVAWLLNRGTANHDVWAQVESYPVFSTEEKRPVRRVTLREEDGSYAGVTLTFLVGDDAEQTAVYASSGTVLTVAACWTEEDPFREDLILPEELQPADEEDRYTCTVPEEDAEYAYIYINDPGLDWYTGAPSALSHTLWTARQLLGLASLLNGTAEEAEQDGMQGRTLILGRDIDLLPAKHGDWTPIGTAEQPFAGTLDGAGHAVTGLKIGDWDESVTASDLGFFAFVSGTVLNLHVSGEVFTTGDRVGSVAANTATGAVIYACSADTELHGGSFTGGILGKLGSEKYGGASINGCVYSGQIYATGSNVGGILGGCVERNYFMGGIQDCENSGIVYAPGGTNVGGIEGYAWLISVSVCRNSGPVQGSRYLGGIAGYCHSYEIQTCCNTGKLLNGRTVGGIVGYTDGWINTCWNLGEITSTMQAGGIVGTYSFLNCFRHCYSFNLMNDGLPLAGSVSVSDPYYLNYYPDCCYYSSAAAETETNWRGAAAFPAEAFSRGGALWYMNGGTEHGDTWVQGENGPVLRDEAEAETVYRLTIRPAGEAAAEQAAVRFPEERSWFLAGASQMCFPEGGSAELTVEWRTKGEAETDEEELFTRILAFQPANAVTRAEDEEGRSHYWIYDVSADTEIVYTVLEEDETGYGWYLSDPEAENFLLSEGKQLYALAAIVNGTAADPFTGAPIPGDDFRGQTVLLAADMDLTEEWTPIGTRENPFAGAMDGSGAVIRGLHIGTAEEPAQGDDLGFFGVLGTGSDIRGLTVIGDIWAEGDNIGGIAGILTNGSLTNCRFGSETEPSSVTGRDRVGGVLGFCAASAGAHPLDGSVNCAAVTGRDSVGGVFGETKGGFQECRNHGVVTGRDQVGGIVGKSESTGYANGHLYLTNTGAVNGRDKVGGLMGELYTQRRIAFDRNTGAVAATGVNVGGITGHVTWEPFLSEDSINIDYLDNSGSVAGESFVGGAFGSIEPVAGLRRIRGSLQLIHNGGSVTAGENAEGASYAGGIAGYCALPYHYAPFTAPQGGADYACGNDGAVTGSGAFVGGIAGYMASGLDAGSTVTTDYPPKPINSAAVTGGDYTGGVAGYAANGLYLSGNKQDTLLNTGAVTGRDKVGGFIGSSAGAITGAAQSPVTNRAPVTGRSGVGGIVGETGSAVTLAQNQGTVAASGTAGGIIGLLTDTGSIVNSFAMGRVYAVAPDAAPILGGPVGEVTAEATLRGSYYANENSLLPLTGSGWASAADCFFLWEGEAPEAWTGIPASAGEFASGYVAWRLDGGRLSRSRVWTQAGGLPALAEKPVWRLRLSRGNAAPEGCALTVAPSEGYSVLHGEEGSYTLYAVSGTAVSLVTELTGTYKVTLSPKPEGTATQTGYTFPLNRDHDLTYRFYQQVNADYAWYFDAPEGAAEYVIRNEAELLSFANLVNGTALDAAGELLTPDDFAGKTVRLGADIRWTGGSWAPAGTLETPFRGIFDGAGYGILDLFSTGSSDLGLFGYLRAAVIQNLNITGHIYNVGSRTGGLAAKAVDSDFVNCLSAMTITGEGEHTGGLVGEGELCRFTGCAFTGTLCGWGGGAGGIIGSAGPGLAMTDCVNSGGVTGDGGGTGGLVGRAGDQAVLTDCVNTGDVTGLDDVGGLAGVLGNEAAVTDCRNTGGVNSRSVTQSGITFGSRCAGGVAGRIGESAVLEACENGGGILSEGQCVGGIAGQLGGGLRSLRGCVNTGAIALLPAGGNDGGQVGGIVGAVLSLAEGGEITRCVNRGDITGAVSGVGGIAGVVSGLREGQLTLCLNYGGIAAAGNYAGNTAGILGYAGISNRTGPDRCVNLGTVTVNGNKSQPITGYGASCPGCFFLRTASLNDRSANRRIEADFRSGRVAWELDALGRDSRTFDWSYDETGLRFADETHGPVFALTVADAAGGTLTYPAYARLGDAVTLAPRPEAGMLLTLLTVTDAAGTEVFSGSGEGPFAFAMPRSDVTVSAEWAADDGETHTVILRGGGGTFPDGSDTLTLELTTGDPLPEPPERAGYDFDGWVSTLDAAPYPRARAVTEDLDLTALWREKDKVVLRFDLNGGEGDPPAEQMILKGCLAQEPPAPRRSGRDRTERYDFLGWFTYPRDGELWNFRADPVDRDTVLFAHWEKKDCFAEAEDPGNPFGLETAEELGILAQRIEAGEEYADRYFALSADLTLDGTWPGLGSGSVPFRGSLDGAGHTVTFAGAQCALVNVLGDGGLLENIRT